MLILLLLMYDCREPKRILRPLLVEPQGGKKVAPIFRRALNFQAVQNARKRGIGRLDRRRTAQEQRGAS
jgi:hypothetical protein